MEFSAPVTVTETAAKCFSEVSNYPSLKTAWFDNEEGVYHAIWSQTHPVTKSKILSQRTVVNGFQTEPGICLGEAQILMLLVSHLTVAGLQLMHNCVQLLQGSGLPYCSCSTYPDFLHIVFQCPLRIMV